MKNLYYAIRHPRQVDWRNPLKVSRRYAVLYMVVTVMIAVYSVFVTPNLPTFFADILFGLFILTFVVALVENTRRGMPLWSVFCGTPVKVPLEGRVELALIRLWLTENVHPEYWALDVLSKERVLLAKDRDIEDLSYLTDNVYIMFLRREDALMFKLNFG